MKSVLVLILPTFFILAGCATNENACEDVTLASEQVQQCQALQRQITQAKTRPLIRTELERRYQTDCIDMRYYRDEHQAAICGNKDNFNKTIDAAVEESAK